MINYCCRVYAFCVFAVKDNCLEQYILLSRILYDKYDKKKKPNSYNIISVEVIDILI